MLTIINAAVGGVVLIFIGIEIIYLKGKDLPTLTEILNKDKEKKE